MQFSYKEKEQKFPLRNKHVNYGTKEVKPLRAVKQAGKDVKAGAAGKPGARRPPAATIKKKPDANMVTLTETQLNTILQTIGKMTSLMQDV